MASGAINLTYPFALNEWHHVVTVGDGNSLNLYFDGALTAAANSPTASYGTSSYSFNIGGGGVYDGSGNWFKGQIDEVALWRRALSSNEVVQLLRGASGSQVSFSTNILKPRLRNTIPSIFDHGVMERPRVHSRRFYQPHVNYTDTGTLPGGRWYRLVVNPQ